MKICPRCERRYSDPADEFCTADGGRLLRLSDYEKSRGDPMIGRDVAGRFSIIGAIGSGGMGTVYKAVQSAIGREVALKVLNRELTDCAEVIERFKREAKAASLLKSPHTVMLHDFGQDEDGLLFLAMELLDGEPLSRRIKEGAIGWRRALEISSEITDSLIEAHQVGIIHRDLKPDNIILVREVSGKERAKVLDFGIAKLLTKDQGAADALTQKGVSYGTPGYMSPEQATGVDVDHQTDLYALGVVLYEMLAGEPPFEGKNSVQLMSQHIGAPVPPIASRAEGDVVVPEEVEDLVMALLEKDPDDRPATAREVSEELDGLLSSAVTPAMATALPPPPRRVHLWSALGAGLAFALVGLAGWSVMDRGGRGGANDPTPIVATQVTPGDEDAGPVAERRDAASRTDDGGPASSGAEGDLSLSGMVPVVLSATPDSARFWLDGVPLEGNEYSGVVESAPTKRRLSVKAKGYVPQVEMIVIDGPTELSFSLEPARSRPRGTGDGPERPPPDEVPPPTKVPGLPPPDVF